MFQGKQKFGRSKGKKVGFSTCEHKAHWRENCIDCKNCHINHGENEMRESNTEYKRFAYKYLE